MWTALPEAVTSCHELVFKVYTVVAERAVKVCASALKQILCVLDCVDVMIHAKSYLSR